MKRLGTWLRMSQRLLLRMLLRNIFSRENRWAVVFCLILILLAIFTADNAPLWIYQGF